MNHFADKINSILIEKKFWEWLAVVCLVIGVIFFPIHLRFALLNDSMKQYANINFFVLVAIIIFIILKRELSLIERWLIGFWGVALLCFFASNASINTAKTMAAFANCLIPITMLLYRFHQERRDELCAFFLKCFNIFIFVLFVNAIVEKVSGDVILTWLAQILDSKELQSYVDYPAQWRFFSLWGHALTNALLFNMFFILNDCYYRYNQKKYPKIIYFMISLIGVLLCASKTAIVVLVVYFVASSYRSKWILIGSGAGATLVFVLGGFDLLIERFQTTALTSGRMERLIAYFNSDLYPLGIVEGYGTGSIYSIEEINPFVAGFEFPIVMHALDYGIIFSVICIGSIYVYMTYHFFKEKQYYMWIGYSLIYVEVNVYNGICLRNQDIFIILCVFSMLLLNICRMNETRERGVVE